MFNHMAKAYAVKCMRDMVAREMKSKKTMKIICILQNAWGDGSLPIVFKPNPYNKSASVIRKMVGEHTFHFCNTTPIVTNAASGQSPIDTDHFRKVLQRIHSYDIILVCGKQAEKAVSMFKNEMNELNKPIYYIQHPAARNLTNVMISQFKETLLKDIEEMKTPNCDGCSNKATMKMSNDGRVMDLKVSSNKQNHTFCDTCGEDFIAKIEKEDPIEDTDWDDFD